MSYFEFAQSIFNERYYEVESFLDFAQTLKDEHKKTICLTREYEHILKSNICLMQYNLLESSFLELYKGLYEVLKDSDISLDRMNSQFVCYVYGLIRRATQKKVENLKNVLMHPENTWNFSKGAVFTCFEIDEEEKKFLVNGNLDGRKIKEFVSNWGIDTTPLESIDLTDLKTLKDDRQLLAHGGASFSDVGKKVSWDTLVSNSITIKELFDQTKTLFNTFSDEIKQISVSAA
ncbi:MAE_28990/MAE_18760 family HEPN-like nuclease [Acinetobacter pittii]|uniref:MAE_28990/MAE_18760 family HEPN-like nuclease n=1 Tax=Acinetobacter pittii TaxID=48296 RepID=UPI00070A74BE|nr:MAE_28990/MAE_18760 family HEPN-like nuclease [Acinetobacter pittii]KRI52051.1 hypothetical protein APC53_06210 [Acinetobacter pittii]